MIQSKSEDERKDPLKAAVDYGDKQSSTVVAGYAVIVVRLTEGLSTSDI